VWNTREVRQALPAGAWLHVDASQAPFTEKLGRSHYGADLLVFDGGKLGVRAAGCLIAPRTIMLAPLYGGGGQERGVRSGTQNPEAALAFAAALGKAAQGREAFTDRARKARAVLLESLASVDGLVVHEGRAQAPNILNLSLPGRDTDFLVALLDEAGFAVSTRSACETDSEEGSRAVFALTGDAEQAKATLRISWGPLVGTRDLARFAEVLKREISFVDTRDPS
jgi:cysteine desulfurase